MTVPVQDPVANHIGNGVTTAFAFGFKLLDEGDLLVTVAGVVKTLGVDYTIAGIGVESGGTVTFSVAPVALAAIDLVREVPLNRTTDYQYSGEFESDVVNRDFDRLVMMMQDSDLALANTIRLPPGDDSSGVLPNAADRALKGLAFDSNGDILLTAASGNADVLAAALASNTTPTLGGGLVGFDPAQAYATGTVGDGIKDAVTDAAAAAANIDAFKTDVASSTDTAKGASLMGYKLSAAGSVGRTLAAKLAEQVSVKDFGAVGDGVANDTAAVQAAVTYSVLAGKSFELFFPAGVYRLTAPITMTSPCSFFGAGASPFNGPRGTRGGGSWILFDHAGVGLAMTSATGSAGFRLQDIGTCRNQPAPSVAWAPGAFDWDISAINVDLQVRDCVLFNPTKGILHDDGNFGRLTIDGLHMDAFQTGVSVVYTGDVARINDIHIWPFSTASEDVATYTKANLIGINLERADNPLLSNIFTIFASKGLNISGNVDGTVSKLHLMNADFDRGKYGIFIDGSADGCSGQLVNVTTQPETGLAGTCGVVVEADTASLDFVNLRIDQTAINGIRVTGTGARIRLTSVTINSYNLSAGGWPAIEASVGNAVTISDRPTFTGGGGAAVFGGAGGIASPLNDGASTANTDGAGDVTITHGCPIAPRRVFIQHTGTIGLIYTVRSITATQFIVRFFDSAGSAWLSGAAPFCWQAGY